MRGRNRLRITQAVSLYIGVKSVNNSMFYSE